MEGREGEGFCLRDLFYVRSQSSVGNEGGRNGVGDLRKESEDVLVLLP